MTTLFIYILNKISISSHPLPFMVRKKRKTKQKKRKRYYAELEILE